MEAARTSETSVDNYFTRQYILKDKSELHRRICAQESKQTRAIALMMEAARTSETSVDNYFTRQYIPDDKSELHRRICAKNQTIDQGHRPDDGGSTYL
jgi:uncharacterized protein YdaU (DUF1376 family)